MRYISLTKLSVHCCRNRAKNNFNGCWKSVSKYKILSKKRLVSLNFPTTECMQTRTLDLKKTQKITAPGGSSASRWINFGKKFLIESAIQFIKNVTGHICALFFQRDQEYIDIEKVNRFGDDILNLVIKHIFQMRISSTNVFICFFLNFGALNMYYSFFKLMVILQLSLYSFFICIWSNDHEWNEF